MAQFILRVDDCGWNVPHKQDDRGLEYFRRWRDTAGLVGLPVYYGFIPTTVGLRELDWLRENLTGDECVAVHGYDHAEGRDHTEDDLLRSLKHLHPAEKFGQHCAYIPPFNAYTEQTIKNWWWADSCAPSASETTWSIFFGGFPGEHHSLSRWPAMTCGNVLHIPACRDLYARAAEIIPRLDAHILEQHPGDPPEVVTLHVTWDWQNLASVGELVTKLKPHLVPATAAMDWLQSRGVQA